MAASAKSYDLSCRLWNVFDGRGDDLGAFLLEIGHKISRHLAPSRAQTYDQYVPGICLRISATSSIVECQPMDRLPGSRATDVWDGAAVHQPDVVGEPEGNARPFFVEYQLGSKWNGGATLQCNGGRLPAGLSAHQGSNLSACFGPARAARFGTRNSAGVPRAAQSMVLALWSNDACVSSLPGNGDSHRAYSAAAAFISFLSFDNRHGDGFVDAVPNPATPAASSSYTGCWFFRARDCVDRPNAHVQPSAIFSERPPGSREA